MYVAGLVYTITMVSGRIFEATNLVVPAPRLASVVGVVGRQRNVVVATLLGNRGCVRDSVVLPSAPGGRRHVREPDRKDTKNKNKPS